MCQFDINLMEEKIMVDKLRIDDVEKVSLEFAKAIICSKGDNGSTVIDESLIIEATDLAIDWLAGEGLRSSIVEQRYPNWIDLSKEDKNFSVEIGKQYWFVAERLNSENQDELPEIIEAKFLSTVYHFDPIQFRVEAIVSGEEYRALYFIPENSSKVFKQDFHPMPPQGVKVKNTKFSPHLSYKNV